MLTRTLIRSSSATVMFFLLAMFVAFLLNDTLTGFVTHGYGPSALGKASMALPFAAAACAGSAAWEAARLKRGRVFEQAPARSRLGIALPVLVPVWSMGAGGLAVALAVSSTAVAAAPPLTHWGMLLAQGLLLAANTLIGYLLGCRLPGLAAAPLGLVAGFFLMAFPASWESAWPRQLVAGGFGSCCSVGSVISQRAVWVAVLFAAAVCAASLAVIHRATRATALLALSLVAGALAIAIPVAKPLGYDPVIARDASELVCDTQAHPQICLWPETADRGKVVQETRAYVARMGEAGLPVPAMLTQNRRPGPGETTLGINESPRLGNIAANLANAVLPPLPECARATGRFAAYPARGPLIAWITAVATQAPPQPGPFRPEDAALAQKILEQPRQTQLAWYETNRQALTTCDQPPRLDPKGAGQ
ncbi:hypothetical protein [Streptomyces sp. WAC06614]|uniref:DUF7224 domain-containing protein n=1 Tax=Streptomyces sp. WAC06614 TaxID=2487416 RepID=UPI000F79D4D8|nr:hypothetical protein [Streptomyces sp. WAC06614]RSS72787.1 hypothetical protein EF918_26290 [Streptomyces sp. WAC06614]